MWIKDKSTDGKPQTTEEDAGQQTAMILDEM